MIRQGDVFWLSFDGVGSEPAGRRPAVVVQHDRFNRTALATTVVVPITSNRRLAAAPGNVALPRGEASLRKASVVDVTQVMAVDRTRLLGRVGSVSPRRLREILRGLALVLGTDAVAGEPS